MSTASNSATALAPRTGFVYPYSRGAVGLMNNASNLSTTSAKYDAHWNVIAIEGKFEEMVRKAVFAALVATPLAQLEAILDRRRCE